MSSTSEFSINIIYTLTKIDEDDPVENLADIKKVEHYRLEYSNSHKDINEEAIEICTNFQDEITEEVEVDDENFMFIKSLADKAEHYNYIKDVSNVSDKPDGELYNHERKQKKKTYYECDYCSYISSRQWHFRRHMLRHADNKYTCEHCRFKTSKKHNLKEHMNIHGLAKFNCPYCHLKFDHKGHFNQHIVTHNGNKNYECPICPAKFSRRSYVKVHILTHSRYRHYQCDICDRKFKHRGGMKQHNKKYHPKDLCSMKKLKRQKSYHCSVCGITCCKRRQLREHMSIHESPSFECSQCFMQFFRLSYLQNHGIIHQK